MKKFIVVLSMITCIFGMTACGSEPQYTALEQEKMTNARAYAVNYVAPYFIEQAEGYDAKTLADSYTNDEIAVQYKKYGEEVTTNIKTANQIAEELPAVAEQYGMSEEDFIAYMDAMQGGQISTILAYKGMTETESTFATTGSIIKSGLASVNTGFDIVGKFDASALGEATSKIDGDTIIVTIPVNTDGKSAQMDVIVSNDQFLALESVALNVQYTMGETMAKAGQNTLVGMGTVFAVLILISLLISAFQFIPKIQEAFAKKESPKEAAMEKVVTQIAAKEEVAEDLTDDLELVAVIAAAIAAAEGQATTDGFVVRSIRKRR